MNEPAIKSPRMGTGFESGAIYSRKGAVTCVDNLVLTQHTKRFRKDLRAARSLGIQDLRYSLPWNQIQPAPNEYDWSWMDRAMAEVKELEFDVIGNPFHFACPAWIGDGFLNPDAPRYYVEYLRRCLRRYPWVKSWALINEPMTLSIMSGLAGKWFPWASSDANYVTMVINLARAICLGSRAVLEFNPGNRIIYIDPTEHHRIHKPRTSRWDEESGNFARFLNERRFLLADMCLGRVDERHPMWWYLERYGMTKEHVEWFHENAARIHVMGLDCYFLNTEHLWQKTAPGHLFPGPDPRGFAEVMLQYIDHFATHPEPIDFRVTEFNTPGYVADKITGLKYMLQEYHKVERWLQTHSLARYGRKVSLLGLDFFPFVDSVGWWKHELSNLSACVNS